MSAQRFAVGQRVRTRPLREGGHTRLPAYLAEREGVIARVHGAFPLADERAEGRSGLPAQALYGVAFDARDIWGTDGFTVTADLWDAYLEEAS